jgi:hypothetical protein
MKRIKATGVVLIAVGVLALIVGRIGYTTQKEVVTIGSYQTPIETRRVFSLRPFGALSVLGGLILIAGGKRVQIFRRPRVQSLERWPPTQEAESAAVSPVPPYS